MATRKSSAVDPGKAVRLVPTTESMCASLPPVAASRARFGSPVAPGADVREEAAAGSSSRPRRRRRRRGRRRSGSPRQSPCLCHQRGANGCATIARPPCAWMSATVSAAGRPGRHELRRPQAEDVAVGALDLLADHDLDAVVGARSRPPRARPRWCCGRRWRRRRDRSPRTPTRSTSAGEAVPSEAVVWTWRSAAEYAVAWRAYRSIRPSSALLRYTRRGP